MCHDVRVLLMDDQIIKEEVMQFMSFEHKFKGEVKSSKELIESNKFQVLTGARKTMPSARKSHSESGIMKSRLININAMSSEISTEPERTSTILNIELSSVVSTSNSTSFGISRNNIEASETKTQNAINSDKQIKRESSLESTYEQKSNRPLSSQTKTNSLENERKIYRKRSIESGDSSNTRKVFVKKFSQCKNWRCEIRNDANSNVSIHQKKTGDYYKSAETSGNRVTERFDCTKPELLPIQRKGNGQENSEKSERNKSLKNLKNLRGIKEKQVKNVRFLGEENKNPEQANKTQLHDGNIARSKFLVRHAPQILISQNKKGKAKNILNLFQAKNELPGTSLRNINAIRPTCYHMPPTHKTLKNTFLFPRYSFQVHSPHGRKVGTATRSTDQNMENCKVVFPQQFSMRNDLTGNVSNRVKVTRPPFAVSRIEMRRQGKRNSLRISNGYESTSASENKDMLQNQTCAVSSRSNPDGSVRESEIFTASVKNKNSNPVEQTAPKEQIGVVTNTNTAGRASNTKEESDGGDKIQKTRMTLTKIAKLLQNVNKDLSSGFECPGLESSLPIWQAELEQCILSVEKVKSFISAYQAQKK